MSFVEKLRRARQVLHEEGRLSMRGLSRELDAEGSELDEIIEELVEVQGVARREGRVLIWCEPAEVARSPSKERNPLDYTPKHLADKILQSKSVLEGERKHVTVMFADVKGSMALAEQVDPEEWHRILERFFSILGEGVHRFEGTVNQYTGDGIMALFGAPIAHEDHAQRACYASLHLLEGLRDYTREIKRSHALDFAVRIGLNSGDVVVGRIGDDLRMDYTAQGYTVGLAQRMETLAEPNSCALSENTRSLVGGYFDLEDLGEFSLKGVADPVRVSRLGGIGAVRTRLDLSRARGFTKFVGREAEIASLDDALEEALAENGRVVGVVAPAGTGKSRLCLEFVERCRARGLRVNEAHCPAHGESIAYLPLLEMLRSIFEINDRDGDHEARRKIAGELLLLDAGFQELIPLVCDFLGVPDPERPAPELSPEARQRQLMAFVRKLTAARGQQEPTVLLLDDLHWIDPGSDAFFTQAIEAVKQTRTLFVVNFRPEYSAKWMSKSYYRQLALAPLGREAIAALLLDLLGADDSIAALPERIYERTEGNPFFVEEVVQSLIESGSLEGSKGAYRLVGPVDSLEIPTTVQSVLAARIDRLGEREKQLLQTASVVGKEISASILAEVAGYGPDELSQALSHLMEAEFMFEKSLYPEVEYAFKHPLTHEVAYHSQLGERRALTHAAVAKAMEAADGDSLDERAALLAHHWERADDAFVASRWHRRAALWCARVTPRDALMHWQRVRALLSDAPREPEISKLRLEAATLCLNLGWRQGMNEAESYAIFEEGRALAEEVGDLRQRVLVGVNLASNLSLSGAPADSLPVAHETLEIAKKSGDIELEYLALDSEMNLKFYTGEIHAGVAAIDRRLEIAAEVGSEIDGLDVPVDFLRAYAGYMLIQSAEFDEALERIRSAEVSLRQLNNIQSLSWWSTIMAEHRVYTGHGDEALPHARRAVELGDEVGSDLARVWSNNIYGEAALATGDYETALHHLKLGLDVARATRGFLTQEARFLAGVASALLAAGEYAEAIETAREGVTVGVSRRTPVYEARARSALARILLETEGLAAIHEIREEMAQCSALIEATGAALYQPQLSEVRAGIALRKGDIKAVVEELRDAQSRYAESGADGHAARIGRQLGE